VRLSIVVVIFSFLILPAPTHALDGSDFPSDGIRVIVTDTPYDLLVARLDKAVEDHGMIVVTRASASAGAAKRGVMIPGNLVVGVFRNDFAVRMLDASLAAGIEAPLRFYLTENEDRSGTLSYRMPSATFAPYGSPALDEMAAELDDIFAAIAGQATK